MLSRQQEKGSVRQCRLHRLVWSNYACNPLLSQFFRRIQPRWSQKAPRKSKKGEHLLHDLHCNVWYVGRTSVEAECFFLFPVVIVTAHSSLLNNVRGRLPTAWICVHYSAKETPPFSTKKIPCSARCSISKRFALHDQPPQPPLRQILPLASTR